MRKFLLYCLGVLLLGLSASNASFSAAQVLVPRIDGNFWKIAGEPDLGVYTSSKQQPVDFAIWQAADGTWQLWSCIREPARLARPGSFIAGKRRS